MILFLLKGLLRDRSRSLFPFITVFIGVFLTVVFFCWVRGFEGNMMQTTAKLDSGHVKIMTRAYAEESGQFPNDLALLDTGGLLSEVREEWPRFLWTPRIKFGGLIDVPDVNGETRAQGPVFGMAVDLLNPASSEREILGLDAALVRGRLPERSGEALVSDDFAGRLKIVPGDTVTLISSTMYGSMTTANFILVGTIRFGATAMDRGSMLADIGDIRSALDMEDAAGEILGFSREGFYDNREAGATSVAFNARFQGDPDEFAPLMDTLRNQSGLADMLDMVKVMIGVLLGLFILAMSIVLWNTGLMGHLRRHGEIGVRLAMGEEKGHVYRSMLGESLMIGVLGTFAGTAAGLALAYILQAKGIDISNLFENASLLVTTRMRARVTPLSFVVGFLPGLAATFLGTSIAGIVIYKRQTSRLIKELET